MSSDKTAPNYSSLMK